ncbi:MAG: RNA 3'-terminal phosphate cyclase [Parahaliea sp.]
MIEIDGSQGEGGGQILRTSLSLAACLGKSVRISNIRAGRQRPGLLRQHLTCVKAAQAICNAQVKGAELGASEVTFKPGPVVAGDFHFAIGSAGSTTLVFQTVLPPLLLADAVSNITFEGGTHNGMAPSYDFIEQCFLPVLVTIGAEVESELEHVGFYPAGGGRWRAKISPLAASRPLTLLARGEQKNGLALATSANIPEHVNERELAHVHKKCQWPQESLRARTVHSMGPGNILSIRFGSDTLTEVFEVVGEKGLSAERVAGRAIQDLRRYLKAGVPVGEHLADQLILPLLLAKGGRFRTLRPSQHLLTNIEVIQQFAAGRISCEELGRDDWQVTVAAIY